jgi:hypothetical protein
MDVQTNCPACGAQITVPQAGGYLTCPYCSTHFQVSMEGTQPSFKVTSMVQEAAAEQPPAEPAPPLADTFGQTTGEPLPPVYTPPANRLFGGRLWLVIAIAAAVIFCLACLCMFAVARGIFK